MKIKDAFYVYSYHQITEEEIYLTNGNIPIYTGNNDIKGYWDKEFLNDGESYIPCISYPVKGNRGVCYVQYKKFDANNTGIIVPNEKYKSKINLEWFKYKFSKLILRIMTNNHGVGYLNKTDIQNIEFELLEGKQQAEELSLYQKAEALEDKVKNIVEMIDNLLSKNIFIDSNGTDKIKLGNILKHVSRNDKLSIEGIYNNCPEKGEEIIQVLSGSSEELVYGDISKDIKGVHYLNDMQCLNIITRGNAGKIRYLPRGAYATNTNSYLFYMSKKSNHKLNIRNQEDEEVYLKFLKIYLEPKLIDLSSNGDVGILSINDILNLEIPIICINDRMRELVKEYFQLLGKRERLSKIINDIDNLCSKIIIRS